MHGGGTLHQPSRSLFAAGALGWGPSAFHAAAGAPPPTRRRPGWARAGGSVANGSSAPGRHPHRRPPRCGGHRRRPGERALAFGGGAGSCTPQAFPFHHGMGEYGQPPRQRPATLLPSQCPSRALPPFLPHAGGGAGARTLSGGAPSTILPLASPPYKRCHGLSRPRPGCRFHCCRPHRARVAIARPDRPPGARRRPRPNLTCINLHRQASSTLCKPNCSWERPG